MTYWIYISAVAAVAIAGTYILWGPANRPKRKKKDTVPGLQNLGNSCFLNAVLQGLASCTSCISWLVKDIEYAHEFQNENCILIKSILTVLSALNGSYEHCSGAEVIKALKAHRWMISHEEQDAHELFHVLTTTVEEELLALERPVLSLLDANKLDASSVIFLGHGPNNFVDISKRLKENKKNTTEQVKTFVSSKKTLPMKLAFPMRGLLVNELRCNSCNYKHPVRYDAFDSISLVIPSPNSGKLTLHDLLLKFISRELIQDVVCEFCPKDEGIGEGIENKPKTTFSQQVSFGKLPECLCIHIQRTVWLKNGLPVKCYDNVSFPNILIMDHFVHNHVKKERQLGANNTRLRLTGGNSSKTDQQNIYPFPEPVMETSSQLSSEIDDYSKGIPPNLRSEEQSSSFKYIYLLKAVIVHLGDASSGHFITYRRVGTDRQSEKWFYTSDLDVKEVSFSEVSRASAYMLFYEKIK